ncbi:Hypothetical predicted protein [Cloeon dipterum]|uniref:Uncharacterized protein n=1 Tax=Cloeon dipterum TaxID=197152 RepID=A0A8S1E1X4_9INSE|nr:Hypothetical predicted protein [Cloeon dipterum]
MFQGLVDFLVFLILSAYYIIESIIINLIPRHYRAGWRETLRGEIALVTLGVYGEPSCNRTEISCRWLQCRRGGCHVVA